MKRLLFVVISAVLVPFFGVFGQKSPQFSQFLELQSAINPAFVASDDMMSVGGVYRLQWAGFSRSPKNLLVSVAYPLKIGDTRHGIGVIFAKDDVGLFTDQSVLFQYSYRFKLLRGELSLGLDVGFMSQTFDKDEVDLTGGDGELMGGDEYHKESDPFIDGFTADGYSDVAFDVSFGCMYKVERGFVGISAKHLNAPKIDLGSSVYQMYVPRYYYAAGGYTFDTAKPEWTVTPSAQFRTDFSTWMAEVLGLFEYKKRVRLGLAYRFGDAFVFHFGLDIIQGLRFGYTYDLPTSKMVKSGGSHEFSLRYSFKPQFAKKNKYKSERIL